MKIDWILIHKDIHNLGTNSFFFPLTISKLFFFAEANVKVWSYVYDLSGFGLPCYVLLSACKEQ